VLISADTILFKSGGNLKIKDTVEHTYRIHVSLD